MRGGFTPPQQIKDRVPAERVPWDKSGTTNLIKAQMV